MPYLEQHTSELDRLLPLLETYLGLLSRWNARLNLTAVREEDAIVTRHFGESLFLGSLVPDSVRSLTDYGSGAGFPGLPLQMLFPELRVVLIESQGKKAAFLREVVREMGLSAEVWCGRGESFPPEEVDAVCLRAVDPMRGALQQAARISRRFLLIEGSSQRLHEYRLAVPGWQEEAKRLLPSQNGSIAVRWGRMFHVER